MRRLGPAGQSDGFTATKSCYLNQSSRGPSLISVSNSGQCQRPMRRSNNTIRKITKGSQPTIFQSLQALTCFYLAYLCSLVFHHSPSLPLPQPPRPSHCSWTIPSSSLAQCLCVCGLFARNIPSLDVSLGDSFLFLALSSVSNFLSPALSFSSVSFYFVLFIACITLCQ